MVMALDERDPAGPAVTWSGGAVPPGKAPVFASVDGIAVGAAPVSGDDLRDDFKAFAAPD
jgi:hypothetical protein